MGLFDFFRNRRPGLSELSEAFSTWLHTNTRNNTLPTDCRALLVGLFEGEQGYMIYLSGSTEYDSSDDDWACNDDFSPEPRYLETSVSPDQVDWDAFQAHVVEIVRQALDSSAGSLLHQVEHVSVGFDDGLLVALK